jgi:hypothetical protein
MGCKKDEAKVSPQEKMLTSHVWVVSKVYVNGQPAQSPPQALLGMKVKFNASIPTGTIAVNSVPTSFWIAADNNYNQLTVNPSTSAAFNADVTKLETSSLWLKVSKDVPFLGVQLTPNTELRMVAE